MEEHEHRRKHKHSLIRRSNRILSIIVDLVFILLCLFIVKIDIIPDKYVFLIGSVLGLVGLIHTIICFKMRKKVVSAFLIILSIIYCLGSLFGIYYLNTTGKFFSNIKEVKEQSIYYVVVNKESSYNNLKDLDGKKLGVFENQSNNYKQALERVKKDVNVSEKSYDNVNNIIKDLYDNSIDSLLINSNNYDMLGENSVDFISKTRIIKKLSIEVIKREIEEETKAKEPFSVYISGIDTNGDISNVSRSDVNIIATINPGTNEVLLTSIPRDYYVQLHDTTGLRDKLTHAGIYGIDMSMNTISDLLDTNINYYLRVNFDTVIKMVDAVGGVSVYSDQAFNAGGYSFVKGMNNLDGKKALAYARERHSFKEGDRKRGKHQQQIITALVKKISSSSVLLTNYSSIMSGLSDSFQTNVSDSMIKRLIKIQLNEMNSWNIKSISLDGTGSSDYTYSMPGTQLYVMIPDENTVKRASDAINGMLDNKTLSELGIN